MKTTIVVMNVALLIVAAAAAIIYSGMKESADRDARIKIGGELEAAYRAYTNQLMRSEIDPASLAPIIISHLSRFSRGMAQPAVRISTQRTLVGSPSLLCVVEYKGRFLCLRGDGESLPLDADSFEKWKKDVGAVPFPAGDR